MRSGHPEALNSWAPAPAQTRAGAGSARERRSAEVRHQHCLFWVISFSDRGVLSMLQTVDPYTTRLIICDSSIFDELTHSRHLALQGSRKFAGCAAYNFDACGEEAIFYLLLPQCLKYLLV
jgi:hypothetical protein